jgi:multiple sugar transport system ATP-binding protein
MTMADKIVVMHDGIIEQIGTPLDLYDRPANRFVAQFIGSPSMNVIEGRIEEGRLQGKDINLTLPEHARQRWDGRRVAWGIRPEQLRVRPDGEIEATVEVVEPTGADTLLFVKAGNDPIVVTLHERIDVRPGETVRLAADPGHVHLFDGETGARLTA